MDKDDALKLALEALENSVDLVREDAYNAEKLYGNYPSRQGKVGGLKVLADDHGKAITVIKQALAQPAPVQEPIYQCQLANSSWIDQTKESYDYNVRHGQATVRIVYTTPPAAPVQEPVAWNQTTAELASIYGEMCAINETPSKDQSPEQIARLKVLRSECVGIHHRRIALNTTPPAAPVKKTVWTEAQHERAYRNSPELHKDVKSLAAFKRVAKEIASMYGIKEKNTP